MKKQVRLFDESEILMNFCPRENMDEYIFSFENSIHIMGYVVLENNKEVYREKFTGAPFVLPNDGGTISVSNIPYFKQEGI